MVVLHGYVLNAVPYLRLCEFLSMFMENGWRVSLVSSWDGLWQCENFRHEEEFLAIVRHGGRLPGRIV